MKTTNSRIIREYCNLYEGVNHVVHIIKNKCKKFEISSYIEVTSKEVEVTDLHYDGNYTRSGMKKKQILHAGNITQRIKRTVQVRDHDDLELCTHDYSILLPWSIGTLIEPCIDDVEYILRVKETMYYDSSSRNGEYDISDGTPLRCEVYITIIQPIIKVKNFEEIFEIWQRRKSRKIIQFPKRSLTCK